MITIANDLSLLSNEELIVLAKKGNSDAFEFLFEKNQRLIGHILKPFHNVQHIDYDDKVQICNIGMIKAYNAYDESKGRKFSTFASLIMRNELMMEIRKFNTRYNKDVSINTITVGNSEGEEKTLEDMLANEEPTFSIEYFWDFQTDMALFQEALDDREKKILGMHLEDISQREIARQLNMNQAHISRILKVIFAKLRYISENGEIDTSININNVCYGANRVKKRGDSVDKASLVFIFENYPQLTPMDISKILKLNSYRNLYRHKERFEAGEYKEIKPNTEIADIVKRYAETKSA